MRYGSQKYATMTRKKSTSGNDSLIRSSGVSSVIVKFEIWMNFFNQLETWETIIKKKKKKEKKMNNGQIFKIQIQTWPNF